MDQGFIWIIDKKYLSNIFSECEGLINLSSRPWINKTGHIIFFALLAFGKRSLTKNDRTLILSFAAA